MPFSRASRRALGESFGPPWVPSRSAAGASIEDALTSGEARRIIRLPEFDGLARTHDEVVYGGRPAEREDAVVARERWPLVLEAKGVRV